MHIFWQSTNVLSSSSASSPPLAKPLLRVSPNFPTQSTKKVVAFYNGTRRNEFVRTYVRHYIWTYTICKHVCMQVCMRASMCIGVYTSMFVCICERECVYYSWVRDGNDWFDKYGWVIVGLRMCVWAFENASDWRMCENMLASIAPLIHCSDES